jgi:AcrR family transcriptional regulator
MKKDRRDTILRAAARLLEHYGLSKTTMADVAREAHIGIGTVYLEFDSKEAIVRELSHASHAGVLMKMREAIAAAKNEEEAFATALMARTRAFLALRAKGQHACELLHCTSEAVQTAHMRFREEELELLRGLLHAGRSDTFATTDARHTAALVQRAFVSLTPPWIYKWPPDQAIAGARDLIALLLLGLLKRTPVDRASPTASRRRRPS